MDGGLRALLSTVLASCVAYTACGPPRLPTPPLAPQSEDAVPIPVPFPPPPARADVILDPPSAMQNPAWIDGQWRWRGRRWVWTKGEWVDLAPDQVYSPPYVVRRKEDGELLWYVGVLRSEGSRGGAEASP